MARHPALAPTLLILSLLAGCATVDPASDGSSQRLPPDMTRRSEAGPRWATATSPAEIRLLVARLLPASVKDKNSWANDLQMAFTHLKIPHAPQTYCAAMAVIEQESTFQADPVVPGLPDIVWRELEQRGARYGIPKLLISAAMLKSSPDSRSYQQRIDALKTEKQLNALYLDMIDELPFGKQLFADANPVRTAGPMQVSIEFAEQHALATPYPYPVGKTIRDEVFTQRGGVYFGIAILLDYPAPYTDIIYRFADFNAGRYSSRNAAFQSALARLSGHALSLDGDLLRYEKGNPADKPSRVETAARQISDALRLNPAEIRRDLLLEKTSAFGTSQLFNRVFAEADKLTGTTQPRQAMPQIDLKSPKITRKLTTEWFARRVETRYKSCLTRGEGNA